MERLTKTYKDGSFGVANKLPCGENSYAFKDLLIKKLGRYEDLEEQGRLIELPCIVGNTVYMPNEKFPAEIEGIRITPQGTFVEYVQYDKGYEETEVWDEGSFCTEDIGKTVFLTKEEAEARLAEMRGAE